MPYVEHVPTVGELILEPFFGKKGIYDLKKIDKETVLNILKKFDMDYEGYQVTSKRNVGMPVFEASKGNDHITIMGKEDITGADREIKLTVVEEKGNVFSERQYIRAGIPGRFGVYLNKLTYFEDGMETSQSREVYSPKELTFEQPIVLIGDRKIYAKDVLQKVDPANLILHLPDTKQVINQVVGVQSEKSLHFTYTVGLNQYSNVDDYVSPALSISLDGNSENVPINMVDKFTNQLFFRAGWRYFHTASQLIYDGIRSDMKVYVILQCDRAGQPYAFGHHEVAATDSRQRVNSPPEGFCI